MRYRGRRQACARERAWLLPLPPPPLLVRVGERQRMGCIYVGSAAATPQSATWSGPEQPSGDYPCSQPSVMT
ncbi:Hypothetical predicted protein [Cloeon dipterum]|uniref:Uncharacterized protein n=1 Tax=Cloeon dipterum TaxID=197152 RepID=A0A8S1D016_9INSE|nr:Hypothetical predicted protein [Cloeon dipterum]